MTIRADVLRGHTDAVILAQLLRRDSYGYEINKTISTLSGGRFELKEATLYTVMSVTENDISLYGFATEEQQSCFELLTAVSGVGPKVGLAILSVMEPDRVALAISAGDHKAFKAASGVGPKLAQRIVLELKDKVAKGFVDGINLEDVGAATAAPAAQGAGQAIAALVSLGYSQSEAALAVSKIDASLPVEEIIKLALRGMAGRR